MTKIKVKLVNDITRKKDPYKNKVTLSAHKKADIAEKKKFPSGYKSLKKNDQKLKKHEFIGENSAKDNTIEISKKLPKKYRKEVIFHEKIELKNKRKTKK